jgi:hypothetical protein
MKKSPLCIMLCCLILLNTGCIFFKSDSRQNIKIAFSYHTLTKEDIDFLSHFDIIVTGKFVDAETVNLLKSHNAKLLYYDWLPAQYYCEHHDDWEELVYQKRFYWTLDPEDSDPNPLGDKYGCMDLFYDMADDELIDSRVDHIVHMARINKYDGVFFDWGSGWSDLKENGYDFLIKEFQKRHPEIEYNEYVKKFLSKIKERGLLVMLNGGFRSDKSELDAYADFDIVESMFTTTDCNNKYYEIFVAPEGLRKTCDTWFNTVDNSVNLAIQLPAKARSANPKIKFLFLNYAFPYYKETGKTIEINNKKYTVYEQIPDRQALFYSLACSYLGNSSGFTNSKDVSLDYAKDNVYLYQLGSAVSDINKFDNNVYVRYFSKGIVIVSNDDATVEISIPKGKTGVLDLYEKKHREVRTNKLMVNLTSQVYPSGLKHPMGRIYIYDEH